MQGSRRAGSSRAPKKPEPVFATIEELVTITNVERQSLRQWSRRGLLPPARIISNDNDVKSRWPRVALERDGFIKEIRTRMGQMYSLDENGLMVLDRRALDPSVGKARTLDEADDGARRMKNPPVMRIEVR